MHILSGIIYCEECGKKFNYKNNSNPIYICQNRKNYGTSKCDCRTVGELFLLEIIEQHCRILNKQFSTSKVKLFVNKIKVSNDHIIIYYKDGSLSEITSDHIKY